ncbi:hypothetical protein [Nocardioides limicola]|uniref:hypothetical protein n=1 Tax=Nocardioides limicola TaxID=2803368 RepID=UPI00193B35A5|nr:hypothetical protein [Nocardioides sp. DJM-14]
MTGPRAAIVVALLVAAGFAHSLLARPSSEDLAQSEGQPELGAPAVTGPPVAGADEDEASPPAAAGHHPAADETGSLSAAADVFSRTYLSGEFEGWHAALEPVTTRDLAQALGTVNPENVPEGEVLSNQILVRSGLTAAVEVTTTSGVLLLELTHLDTWRVHSVDPRGLYPAAP